MISAEIKRLNLQKYRMEVGTQAMDHLIHILQSDRWDWPTLHSENRFYLQSE